MDIWDFITPEQIDELPEDNPRAAFADFVRIAQRSLSDATRDIDDDQDSGWRAILDARHGFMNVVIAAAKKYDVEPFASLEVPRVDDFNEGVHRQFRADLDHYLTQLVLDSGARNRQGSVFISQESKDTIRTYVFHLHEVIEKADMSERKRALLLRRLADFEAELSKKRVNLGALGLLAITLMSAPGGIAATGEVGAKLIGNIMRELGDAKAIEDENRRLPSEDPRAITGPRKAVELVSTNRRRTAKQVEALSQNLDDEIPF